MFDCLHILFTYSIYINTHLQPKASAVNTIYIEEDVFKGCLHNEDFFNRILIDSNLNFCLFVYIIIVNLFIYTFIHNTQLVPKA